MFMLLDTDYVIVKWQVKEGRRTLDEVADAHAGECENEDRFARPVLESVGIDQAYYEVY